MSELRLELKWDTLANMLRDGLDANCRLQREEGERHKGKLPYSLDWSKYEAVERTGLLKLLAARKDGVLVGHAAYILGPHLMHADMPHALNDSIYLRAGAGRGHAVQMVREAERYLSRAVAPRFLRIIYSVPKESPFGAVLARLGYGHVENVHEKLIVR